MRRHRDWSDEHTLLCETCGYNLDSLPSAGACPECGRSIRSSLPSARPGSAWQQRPRIASWFAAAWALLVRPTALFRSIHVGPPSARRLAILNALIAGALVAAVPAFRSLAGRHWFVPWSPRTSDLPAMSPAWYALVVVLLTAAVVAAAFLLLTWIETLGVRFFHNRRGWRVTRSSAWTVCAHATYGWVLAGLLIALGWSLIDVDLAIARALRTTALRWRFGDWIILPPVVGFFIGMMLFEVRVYQGMRLCRFASAPRPPALPTSEPGRVAP